ncbi:hypothetical protein Pan241w_45480 [Gimesia alba]|uniref:Uncharacterized protein n=1 Tax=Gimesia alba TaxID=2527973 RepID=A0A517RKR5_9PLAN|nr:hypothetical protein [Gimesia alba]QDT44439.1 hypothetical protein Pan241w_45480 [Gimesia alba]
MNFPIHKILIQTDSEKKIGGLVQGELAHIPPEIEQAISDRDRFAFRLILEEFVVGLLKEMKSEQNFIQRGTAPHYQLEIILDHSRGMICFNGHQKVVRFSNVHN